MVGAGTARAEHYRRLVREDSARALRRARGLSAEPMACIVSGRLTLNPENIPLLTDPEARVAILTSSQASLEMSAPPNGLGAGTEAGERSGASGERSILPHVEYIRAEREGRLDLPQALRQLRRRFAVTTVLCEGGPHLNTQLLAARLVDEVAGVKASTLFALRIRIAPT